MTRYSLGRSGTGSCRSLGQHLGKLLQRLQRVGLALPALLLPFAAYATQWAAVTPRGEVSIVRQVVLNFSDPMVPMGDPQAPAPATLNCSGPQAPTVTGRWQNERRYTFDFEQPLPPDTACTLTPVPNLRDAAGAAVAGARVHRFNTGAVSVIREDPWPGSRVEEGQHFVLALNGPVVFDSIEANGYCQVEGIGERLPMKIVERDPLLAGKPGIDRSRAMPAGQSVTVSCQRPLPPDAKLTLVWARGIRSASQGGSPGLTRSKPQLINYTVRPAFTVGFACQRVNANAPCSPLGALSLNFSEAVTRDQAKAIRLRMAGGASMEPRFDDDNGDTIDRLSFGPVLPPVTDMTIDLPADLHDQSGRVLANRSLFPMKLRTDDYPPLAKFSAAPFGIVELDDDPSLPITLRNVEADLSVRGADVAPATGDAAKAATPSQKADASSLRLTDDWQVLQWLARLNRYHESALSRDDGHGKATDIETRSLSIFEADQRPPMPVPPQRIALPTTKEARRPFEVVGLPLPAPGFYVVEVQSRMLGSALLGRDAPMYARTGALVTNLSVHFKQGRENSLAWVTALDTGKPVAGAQVRVLACNGERPWQGVTDDQGIARIPLALPQHPDADKPGSLCSEAGSDYLVSATKTDAQGRHDYSFVLSSWTNGIEPWRFNIETDDDAQQRIRAFSVLDRSLLRAGETVSMKHIIRLQTTQGFGPVPADRLPDVARLVHQGSNTTYTLKLQWHDGDAASSFRLPKDAKLGRYEIWLDRTPQADKSADGAADKPSNDGGTATGQASTAATDSGADADADANDGNDDGDGDADAGNAGVNSHFAGSFRVEEFRLPVLQGSIEGPKQAAIGVTELPVKLHVDFLSGGPAADLSAKISAMQRYHALSFKDFDDYRFDLSDRRASSGGSGASDGADDEDQNLAQGRLVADALPVKLDRSGDGSVTITGVRPAATARELRVEATYDDPNGETQTVGRTIPLYPADRLVGIKTASWASVGKSLKVQMVVVDPQGQPQSGVAVELRGQTVRHITTRKRLVGGLYGYDTRTERTDAGVLCTGTSGRDGRFDCDASLKSGGELELVAGVKDAAGHLAQADTSVWVTGQDEVWFEPENLDRMDLLPERKQYEPGQTARFQVRMPFREATALVAVEREGVIDTQVVTLSGTDPTVSVPIKAHYGPNVFVSVLAVRGRIREVPWYSLFTWGWRSPLQWWHERKLSKDYEAPTALVDLSKPAFRLGIAGIRVGLGADRLNVTVTPEHERYQIREIAKTRVRVTLPDGKPAPAGTAVAIAAVDQALLELQPNDSWNLLEGMYQPRGESVTTSTAQMQVIGRRHYGRKAIAPGGGGGRAPTRELFDTLLLWKDRVVLDDHGEASVDIPLNDSLTTFRIVAVADVGDSLFGTGMATIRSSRDLQISAGLPPLVRDGDSFRAMATLRNTTAKPMHVQFTARADRIQDPYETQADVAAGQSVEIGWPVRVPDLADATGAGEAALQWTLSVKDANSAANDSVRVTQKVIEAVPTEVQQANIVQLAQPWSVPVQPPARALPGRSIVRIALQARLSNGLPSVRRYFERYPFLCLEQKTSKSIGLRDVALWQSVAEQIPTYLDSDGLANYFPPQPGDPPQGSDTLTAYLLSVTDEAAHLDPRYAIAPDVRERMEMGLTAFVEGRLSRRFWSPRADLTARKLAAMEALSRTGKVTQGMVETLNVDPNQWPTSAVLDWYAVLMRTPTLPQRQERLEAATQVLRARMSYQGTQLSWSSEGNDFLWWLMVNGDVNSAHLLSLAVDQADHDATWRDDAPRIALGLIGRLKQGHWLTTTANLMGSLAIERFSRRFENDPVTGVTKASLGDQTQQREWASAPAAAASAQRNPAPIELRWPTGAGAPSGPLTLALTQEGAGHPWATLQMLAAVPRTAPISAGFTIDKRMEPVTQQVPGAMSRGDVWRVRLTVTPQASATWVVVDDPIPAGATVLGSGLGRDSQIDSRPAPASAGTGWTGAWVAYEERAFDAYRAYYRFVGVQPFELQYNVRLNNPGDFRLPPTRVQAMYNPEMFGERPNPDLKVQAR